MIPISKQAASASADALEDNQFLLDDDVACRLDSQDDKSDLEGPVPKKRKKASRVKKPSKGVPQQRAPKTELIQGDIRDRSKHPEPEGDKTCTKKTKSHRTQPANQKRNRKNVSNASKKLAVKTIRLQPATLSPNEAVSIGLQPPDLQHNYLVDRQRRALSDLSDLELESLRIDQSWLQDVSGKPLRAHLGSWIKAAAVPDLLDAVVAKTDIPGAPVVVVVSSSALRVVDLCREVKPLVPSPKEAGEVTKLFARHFKLTQHIAHLNTTIVSIGVGTPDRISKLMASEALKLDRLKWVFLDVTWTDPKDYSLAELPDSTLRNALWKNFLGFPKLIEKFKAGETKLVLF